MKAILTLVALSLVLGGCSVFNPSGESDFSCPGMPKGVTCKNPREVYQLTDTDKVKGKGKASAVPTYIFATEPNRETALNPVPVLEQARVMRVWIGPFVDRNNDQHWPGLIFTVIQPKQWHFGTQEFEGVEPPIPHRMFESAAGAAAGTTNSSVEMPKNEENP